MAPISQQNIAVLHVGSVRQTDLVFGQPHVSDPPDQTFLLCQISNPGSEIKETLSSTDMEGSHDGCQSWPY